MQIKTLEDLRRVEELIKRKEAEIKRLEAEEAEEERREKAKAALLKKQKAEKEKDIKTKEEKDRELDNWINGDKKGDDKATIFGDKSDELGVSTNLPSNQPVNQPVSQPTNQYFPPIVSNPSISTSGTSTIKLQDMPNVLNPKQILESHQDSQHKSDKFKKKVFKIRRNFMNDEGISQAEIDERFKKLREQERFNEKFTDLSDKINKINDRVCKDGDCTQRELTEIKKSVGELFEVKKALPELSDIKKNLGGLSEISKRLDRLNELDTIKKDIDSLKNEAPKLEICPSCGEKSVVNLSSFCSNCGGKIHEWADDNGVKISGWKPYWLKNQIPSGQKVKV